MATYYHVTATKYDGSDLTCWHTRASRGEVTEANWKWNEAPVGFDGDLICLVETLEEAQEFRAEFGGASVLRVDFEDGDLETLRNGEGYTAARWEIPACYVTEVAA